MQFAKFSGGGFSGHGLACEEAACSAFKITGVEVRKEASHMAFTCKSLSWQLETK
jgi:hypothetical protein